MVNNREAHLNCSAGPSAIYLRYKPPLRRLLKLRHANMVIIIIISYQENQLPGQGFSLHDLDSTLGPTHASPPFLGAGLSHFLDLICLPGPQPALHFPQAVQLENPPFTRK